MDDDDLFSMLPGSSKPQQPASTSTPAKGKKRSASHGSDSDGSVPGTNRNVSNSKGNESGNGEKGTKRSHREKNRKKPRFSDVKEEDSSERGNRSGGSGSGSGIGLGDGSSATRSTTIVQPPIDPMQALEEGNDAMDTKPTRASASNSDSEYDAVDDTIDIDADATHDEIKGEAKPIMPKVTDDVNMETEREVAATAGFAAVSEQEKMRLVHQVRHQVALPPNYTSYIPISSHVPHDPPAKTYKFTLDPFQRTSVSSIERNESVLVSAHTSAGKTVVAEYAVATCLRDGKRVVYTSPIKALSNQKFRELGEEFGMDRVGLMTGDTTINPDASCLVMTTEILRSMLYRGSEIMREVGWVIFDEIHYMRDKDRGVVWEETIILLPHNVRYVFLSATIPNSMQFAEWIVELHAQPCHVVYTDFRPTPLQHYLFPEGGEGMYLVVDEKAHFREDNFKKAMGALQARQGEDPADPNGGKGRRGKTKKGGNKGDESSDIYKLVKMIILKNLNPVIIFAFSKRECEALAMQMSKLDMNSEDEAAKVDVIFENAMAVLTEEDRNLPQILNIVPLLRRGVGVHHGGLLPILKEVIEILFQEGLIKALFATETFSIGLNMPAKTVVFTKVTKFDGKEFRNLSGGEYIQMSGRAGRRGKDARGIVIMMCDQKIEPEAAKGMVKGQADRLDSAFHLGYNMILNLMRVEGVSPEFMLEKCFYQFQNSMNIPVLQEDLRRLDKQRKDFKLERKEDIQEYANLRQHCEQLSADCLEVIQQPAFSKPFLQKGRVVRVRHHADDFGWGIVINLENRRPPKTQGKGPVVPPKYKPQDSYLVFVLLKCAIGSSQTLQSGRKDMVDDVKLIRPAVDGESLEPVVVPVLGSCIAQITTSCIKIESDVRPLHAKERVMALFDAALKKENGKLNMLDPVKNMNIKDPAFVDLIKKISALENKLSDLRISRSPDLPRLYLEYQELQRITDEAKAVKEKIKAVKSVLQLDELKNRKRVLRRLEFANQDDVIATKGRVACEISTGDELLLTEMIFQGVFNELQPDQCAALLSCFVFDEKSESKVQLKNELAAPLRTLQTTARSIATVLNECKLPVVPEDYIATFKIELMDCVYKWCQGASFAQICTMTDVFEGSIIRVFRRLQELIRQMAMAAKAIGNTELEEKFQMSLQLLERPNTVVFNPSLYL